LFDLARRSYRSARKKATARGDTHSVLLSRIGEAIILKQVGNLAGSRRALRRILAEAEAVGDRDAQARCHHDLGAVYMHLEQTKSAIREIFTAFELYAQPRQKLRALSDLGEAFKREKQYEAARDAFLLVLNGPTSGEMRCWAMIALLELCSLTRDRLGFAHWKRELSALANTLPVEALADFHLQLGLGHARFGNLQAARAALMESLQISRSYNLWEYVSRAECALETLSAGSTPDAEPKRRASGGHASREVAKIAKRLRSLSVS
jgi:tetratricopeptide (TPR) repeat protein